MNDLAPYRPGESVLNDVPLGAEPLIDALSLATRLVLLLHGAIPRNAEGMKQAPTREIDRFLHSVEHLGRKVGETDDLRVKDLLLVGAVLNEENHNLRSTWQRLVRGYDSTRRPGGNCLSRVEWVNVLAGLRLLQETPHLPDEFDHFDDCKRLSVQEIDELCERINLE